MSKNKWKKSQKKISKKQAIKIIIIIWTSLAASTEHKKKSPRLELSSEPNPVQTNRTLKYI